MECSPKPGSGVDHHRDTRLRMGQSWTTAHQCKRLARGSGFPPSLQMEYARQENSLLKLEMDREGRRGAGTQETSGMRASYG
jgi:hypothetical protein